MRFPSVLRVKGLLVGALYGFLGTASVAAQPLERTRICSAAEVTQGLAAPPDLPQEVLKGNGFVLLPAATAAVACLNRAMAGDALAQQVSSAERALGLDVQLAIVLTVHPIGCSDLFYVPIANDIRGIGYGHTNGAEVFDEDPATKLEGIAFLNDIPYWQTYPGEFRTAFLHEVGHRWGARIGALREGETFALTGREGGHWSYFLDSAGSPLEGNAFEPGSSVETKTAPLRVRYSALDLYLMGVAAPEEVLDIRYLNAAGDAGLDCAGHAINAASPPQICESKHLAGKWTTLGIDEVIAREGEREPSFAQAPRTLRVGVFVLGSAGADWNLASCQWVQQQVTERLAEFAAATGQRMTLVNAVGEGTSCAQLVATGASTEDLTAAGGCSMASSPAGVHTRLPIATLAALLGLRLGGSRRRRFKGPSAKNSALMCRGPSGNC